MNKVIGTASRCSVSCGYGRHERPGWILSVQRYCTMLHNASDTVHCFDPGCVEFKQSQIQAGDMQGHAGAARLCAFLMACLQSLDQRCQRFRNICATAAYIAFYRSLSSLSLNLAPSSRVVIVALFGALVCCVRQLCLVPLFLLVCCGGFWCVGAFGWVVLGNYPNI